MILFLGSSRDKVYPRLLEELENSGHEFAVVDEDHAAEYTIERENQKWRIRGNQCDGSRPVGSIFVRHAVARTLDPAVVVPMSRLQVDLNRLLLATRCPVINRPAKAYSNYSKPYQLGLLAQAGFDVPRTLVTNVPEQALCFHDELGGRVIFKGVSNVMSFAQVWKSEHFERVNLLPNSPTQFQEFVSGADYRVHVIGRRAFVTRLAAANEDYRRSALADHEEILAEPAELPADVVERCIRFTEGLGLIVGGIDFKESDDGRLVALELNPYPQFTFYEGRSGQPITRSVVDYLVRHQATEADVFA
jgi:glutathione synthase/RimK-type ligase-like ATP-grasp enzyme